MSTTTTLKLPSELKRRIARLVDGTERSAHAFMLEAIAHQIEHEERLRAFMAEAAAADRKIDRTGEVYAAGEVHAWLDRLARRKAGARRPARPRPCRT